MVLTECHAVFTQWVLLARILGRIFAKEEIKFLYFFGHMTAAQKNAVVNAFHEKPEIKILVSFRPQQRAAMKRTPR